MSLWSRLNPFSGGPADAPFPSIPADELFRRAARAYRNAGLLDDACRVYETLGDYRESAPLHEQRERWGEAGEAYRRAGNWQAAAGCFVRAERFADAVEALKQLGDRRFAAWLLADRLHQPIAAERLLEEAEHADDRWAALESEAVVARCEVVRNPLSSARRLGTIAAALNQGDDRGRQWTDVGPMGRGRLLGWSVTVADGLGRRDLAAVLFASAVTARIAGAGENWQAWARERLQAEVRLDEGTDVDGR